MKTRDISLTAMLGALSAVLRIPFAAFPNIQPSTFLVAASGYAFGVRKGFAVGALTALISSFFLGLGPWTLFQMLAWGLCGAFFGFLKRFKLPIWALAGIAFTWGYIFGFIMNLWYLYAFGFPVSLNSIIALQLVSFWMDTLHATSNTLFFLAFGKSALMIFQRYQKRFGD